MVVTSAFARPVSRLTRSGGLRIDALAPASVLPLSTLLPVSTAAGDSVGSSIGLELRNLEELDRSAVAYWSNVSRHRARRAAVPTRMLIIRCEFVASALQD
jgi:hypothetical protein